MAIVWPVDAGTHMREGGHRGAQEHDGILHLDIAIQSLDGQFLVVPTPSSQALHFAHPSRF